MHNEQLFSNQIVKRVFASGAIGNLIEAYDLILISMMATTLSQVFFPPSSDPYAHTIDILYIFFISLLMRPIGNIVMALFADQIGRKKIMLISLTFTGICSVLIGLLPNYQSIGVWATILFILIRISMNFFAGIEYVNSATYLIENSDQKTKGFFGSWSAVGISGGYLLASLVSYLILHFINKNSIPEWSWRFVFLFSFMGIVFGIWLRYSIPESIEFMLNNANTEKINKLSILKNAIDFIKKDSKQCIAIASLTVLGTFLSYIYYVYIPITLVVLRHFDHNYSLSLNIISLFFIIILIPFFGKLSDNYNRIKLVKIVCVLIILLSFPFFIATSYGTYFQILLMNLLIAIPSACFFSLYPTILIEYFPAKIRCTTSSLIYQIIFSVTMGSLPFIVNFIVNKTKLPYSPAYISIIFSIMGYIGLHLLSKK